MTDTAKTMLVCACGHGMREHCDVTLKGVVMIPCRYCVDRTLLFNGEPIVSKCKGWQPETRVQVPPSDG